VHFFNPRRSHFHRDPYRDPSLAL